MEKRRVEGGENGKRERGRERWCSPICWLTSQMTATAWDWDRPKPATGNSIQGPHTGSRNPTSGAILAAS